MLAVLLGASAAAAGAAQAGTITECTRAKVVDAVAAGGSWTFACDGRIAMAPVTVPRAVTFEADGRDVTFGGTRPNFNITNYIGSTSSVYDNRVFKVVAGGALTLRGTHVEDGLYAGRLGTSGQRGTNGDAGSDGPRGSAPGANGTGGGAGGDGQADATQGQPADAGRGGCILVEEGGALTLRDLTMRRCQAVPGRAGAPGSPGNAGRGGYGGYGADGRPEFPDPATDGGAAGPGGPAGRGAPSQDGLDGTSGQGGAIYSAGALDVARVRFEDNTVQGGSGAGGTNGANGGYGGNGGIGGKPGCTICYQGYQARGGDGGAAGAGSAGRDGGDGGSGGQGLGGAVFAAGQTSVVDTHFARNLARGGHPGDGGDGGSGGGGNFGEPGGCVIRFGGSNSGYDCTNAGERGAPTPGLPGSDGGISGDGGDAIGGALYLEGEQPPPVNTTNDTNQVVAGIGAVDCDAGYNYLCPYGGGGGSNTNHECAARHATDTTPRPPCTYAPSGARGTAGGDGQARDPDAGSDKASGLSVTVDYPENGTPGYRFPLDEPVTVTVTVKVAANAPGLIGGITFDEGVTLRETENTLFTFSGTDPPSGPFALSPGSERTFEVEVTGGARGTSALRSSVHGKDSLGRTAAAGDRQVVKVGQDITVKVTADPDELALGLELDPETGRPPTKPLELTVELQNVSGEDLTDVTLDLQTIVRQLVGRDPLAPYPLQIETRRGEDGQPDTPLTNAQAREIALGALADNATQTLRFGAKAADKAIVDVRASASGKTLEPRTATGSGATVVRIDSPATLTLTSSGPLTGTVQGGGLYTYAGTVQNISPDEDVTVLLRADRRGPITGGQVDLLGEPDDCGAGIFKRLEPGERMPVFGALRGSTEAGGHATIDLNLTGRRHTYDSEGNPIEVPLASADILVGEGADRREVDVFQLEPIVPPISVGGVAWLVSDSAARAFGARVTGAVESVSAARASVESFRETPMSVHLQWLLTVIREEVPEAFDQAQADLVRTLLAFDDQLDSGEAIDIARDVWGRGIVASEQAWKDATWQDLSRLTGTVVGSTAPDLALEAVLPAIGSCKLLKFGGKTAMLRRAERLGATRAGRLLAKGMKGLVPGDEISALLARKLYGIDGVIDSQLIAYAKAKKVVIAVRERSPGSIRRLAEGLLPKWEKVKAKNVSQLDIDFLGFHETHLDTAMLKQMPDESVIRARIAGKDPDTQEKVLARWQQRKKEWEGKDRAAMEAYEQGGKIPAPSKEVGLNPLENGQPDAQNVWTDQDFELTRVGQGDPPLIGATDGLPVYQPRAKKDGKFRAMTGDMDPIAILDEKGQIPSLERRLEIYKDLAKMGFQHPESLTWDNAVERAKYLFDFDLANGEGRALLAYGPDGTRRAAYFDSRKSRLDELKEGYMALLGTEIVLDAKEIVAGEVPVIERPETEAPLYLTPGGSVGANLSDTPGTKLIRRNLNGTFSQWTRERGWQPYTLPDGATLTTTPQTAVRTAVAAGQTRIDINDQDALILKPGGQSWFKPGDLVVIDPGGPNEEFVTVKALGSIITSAPLTKDHVSGEMIAVVPQDAPAPPSAGPAPSASTPLAVPLTPPVSPPAVPSPGGKPSSTAASEPKAKAPRLSAVKLAKRRFSRKSGTKLSFKLDKAARVTVSVKRKVKGRKKGKRCSTKVKRGKRCTAYVKAKTVQIKAKKGGTRITYGKRLKRGTYVARVSVKGGRRVTLRFIVR